MSFPLPGYIFVDLQDPEDQSKRVEENLVSSPNSTISPRRGFDMHFPSD